MRCRAHHSSVAGGSLLRQPQEVTKVPPVSPAVWGGGFPQKETGWSQLRPADRAVSNLQDQFLPTSPSAAATGIILVTDLLAA